jgi:ABC-type Mn2+/Zn2+ transport system permease subunit
MFKLFIIAALILIILQMAWGLKAMYRKESSKEDMVRALTWRVSCSIGLFILLLIGMRMGWIAPN